MLVEVRERLKQLGPESDAGTTGGKEMHVLVPIQPKYDWELVRALTVPTMQMERGNSKLNISKMTKAARTNKIFVDYLRNERDATAIAPYSSRARLGMARSAAAGLVRIKRRRLLQSSSLPISRTGATASGKIRGRAVSTSKQAIPAKLFDGK